MNGFSGQEMIAIRVRIAETAMQALIIRNSKEDAGPEATAREAAKYADALIAELTKKDKYGHSR